jgi:hypothetical protein
MIFILSERKCINKLLVSMVKKKDMFEFLFFWLLLNIGELPDAGLLE